jgi:hypothetical protein
MTYIQPARGIRKSSAIITVAAAATPEVLWQLTNAAQVTRSVIVRKVFCYTGAVANCVVQIGTGLGGLFAAILPPFYCITTFDSEWSESEIPEVEVFADLTVQSDVLGVQVQVEVEEIGPS